MKHLNIDQIKDLLRAIPTACKGSSKLSPERKQLMVLVTFWHALRASETCALRGRDIRHGYVTTARLKGSDSCEQKYWVDDDPLLDESVRLTELSAIVGDDDLLFPMSRYGFHDFLKKAAIAAGINPKWAHPHILKHSLAMFWIPCGIENTRKRLGHKSLSSTGHYLEVDEDQAEAALRKHLSKTGALQEEL
jgi:integrase